MSTFQELESTWKESGLSDMLLGKFQTLLTDESEEGVKSCVELLRSFGDEGLCVVLKQEDNGQIVLREDLGIVHRLLWMSEVVSVITEEGSVWKPLYKSGGFDEMEVQVLGNVEWSNLSEVQQKKVVSFSMSGVEVPAGMFLMGALPNDGEADDDEKPQHKVTLTKGMLVSKYACTQGLYESVMGENPSYFKGSTRPVEKVSWCDAVLFCNKLSEMEGLEPVYVLPEPFENDYDWSMKVKWNHDANGYRLPTEAEWEYCARGGENTIYSGSNNIDEVAWYPDNSDSKTHPVGQKKANGFGLYDMSGNVWEWVWDSWKREYESPTINPIYVDTSSPDRVLRGGSWGSNAGDARVSGRSGSDASFRYRDRGFRFLRTP
ncbi:MAG: hypothetical protein CL916_00445 [Deltaproteobacteria bacterium]|nr:hypothetical protein [Deltaproteobacteria bacterium]